MTKMEEGFFEIRIYNKHPHKLAPVTTNYEATLNMEQTKKIIKLSNKIILLIKEELGHDTITDYIFTMYPRKKQKNE